MIIEGHEVLSTGGAVAAEPKGAAGVGAKVLERGGNAMDAAAAACLASCVLEPEACDIGGYVCCAVVLEGSSGRAWSLDANTVAPAAAHERMFEVLPRQPDMVDINANEYACRVRDDTNLYGPLAVGVPGVMAGIGVLWERWGRLKWTHVVEPSLDLLADGFPYGSTAQAIQLKETVIRRFEPTVRHLMPRCKIPSCEDIWHRADLESTLNRIASAGWQDFYGGEMGRKIADYVCASGGILRREDMAEFQARVTEPFSATYRQAQVYGALLPNGGLSMLQALNMWECFERVPDTDVMYWHRWTEILKQAWRDRLTYLGDPDFVDIPVQKLLSKDYAGGRVERLRQFPWYVDRLSFPPPACSGGTAQISAADAEGNLVAVTISHGGLFGSCLTVPGTGITLGHGMCRFEPRPGRPNSVQPGKRPLNNVAPTVLRLPDRDVATGVRGGRRIISVSAQICQRMVDYGGTSLEAAIAPRLHVESQEPVELAPSVESSIVEGLRALGHDVRVVSDVGFAAHSAEYLKDSGQVRAGGNTWAAGVEKGSEPEPLADARRSD